MTEPLPTVDLDTALGTFRVYAEGTVTRALQNGQWWDEHLRPLIDEAARLRGGGAVDIGAHCGWFTRHLARKFQQVYACEPWPQSFQLLQHNCGPGRVDMYDRVHLHLWPVAAYSHHCRLDFCPESSIEDPGSYAFALDTKFAGRSVAGVPLDEYLPAAAQVALVKCDAQGADLQALQGLRQTILRCRPTVLFEWEEGLAQAQGSTWEDYLRFFHEIGYGTPERTTTDFWDYVARPR